MSTTNPKTGKPVKRSTGPFGCNTIYSPEGVPYMTRARIGRLRLHIFHTGDLDQDHHDHPWDFWTFPLMPYVESVVQREFDPVSGMDRPGKLVRQVVQAFRVTHRPATHCHRVLGRYSGNCVDTRVPDVIVQVAPKNVPAFLSVHGPSAEPYYDARKMITIVWRGKEGRKWGFLKHRDGRWCWIHWKEYVLGGGKDSPCQ